MKNQFPPSVTFIPEIAKNAITLKQTSDHESIRQELLIFSRLTKRPLDPMLIADYLQLRRLNPRREGVPFLMASSTRTLLGTIFGALQVQPGFENLPRHPIMKRTARALQKEKNTQGPLSPYTPVPATQIEVERAVINLLQSRNFSAALVLILWWLTASRPGDILLIRLHNVKFLTPDSISIMFVEGKTCAIIGAYTTATVFPEWMRQLFNQVTKQNAEFVFPPASRQRLMEEVVAALKKQNPLLQARSIRRGALVSMAKAGVSDATLLEFSHHSSVQMLHRYLDNGLWRLEALSRTVEASTNLGLSKLVGFSLNH